MVCCLWLVIVWKVHYLLIGAEFCRVFQRLVGNPVLQGTKTSKLLGNYEKLNSFNFRVITVVLKAVFLLSNGLVLCFLFLSYRRLLLSRNGHFFIQ